LTKYCKDRTLLPIHFLVYYPVWDATVTDTNIYEALNLDWEDFEDSVQFVIGKSFSADYIVTRNVKDYSSSTIPAIAPEQFV
jgi:hypothetical protein